MHSSVRHPAKLSKIFYFNKELDNVTSIEENDDKKKVFKCTLCGKEFVSSRGLKRHTPLKHVQEEVTPKEQKTCLSP